MPILPSPGCGTAPDAHRRAWRLRAIARVAPACLLLVAARVAASEPVISPAVDATAAGMVDVRALAPDIEVEMRYAGNDNFTGAPVPGYAANRCYLLRPAAEALARVQASLRADGLGLRVYDCYRPAHAVLSFVDWVGSPDDPALKARWYPNVDRIALMPGYIGRVSGHSRGATVDLGLLDCRKACTALDMGTGFDYFGLRAHTDVPGLSPVQRGNRKRLLDAMAAVGFVNYENEWWHYTFKPEPTPMLQYDVPVR